MRDRAWRRYIEERIVIRRIRTIIDIYNYWRGLEDANGYLHNPPLLKDFIGKIESNRLKTHSITSNSSRYKRRYSPNKGNYHDRDMGLNNGTREGSRREFDKILKEYGIR
jgi:hypothetical protein